MPGYRDPNRNSRVPHARPDEPRDLGPPDTGSIMHDGYEVRGRKPRVPDYPGYASPERAASIEQTFREYDGLMDYDD
jgi:hypothetical protein